MLNLDFDVNPTRKLKLHEGINRLTTCGEYVDKSFVASRFKLLTTLFIYVWAP